MLVPVPLLLLLALSSINAGKVTNVAVVAVAHSGASLLTALASLPDELSFPLTEPYLTLKIAANHNPEVFKASKETIPIPQDFFNCSFATQPVLVNAVYRPSSCRSVPWIRDDQKQTDLCREGRLSPVDILRRCHGSSKRVIKLVDLRWLTEAANKMRALFPSNTRFIHVVRHPADILRNRLAAEWVELETRALSKEMEAICTEMVFNTAFLRIIFENQTLTVKYEELEPTFTDTYLKIASFLGESPSQETIDDAKEVMHYYKVNSPQFVEEVPQRSYFEQFLSEHETCQEMLNYYNYNNNNNNNNNNIYEL